MTDFTGKAINSQVISKSLFAVGSCFSGRLCLTAPPTRMKIVQTHLAPL